MSNPFSRESNPFADPAVTVHTDSGDQDGYNDVQPATGGAWGQAGGGAWSSPTKSKPPPEKETPVSSPTAEQKTRIAREEAELRRRETDLVQRERQLNQRANQMQPTKNWPRCRPILYHDIDAEIPDSLRVTVKWGYWTYLLFMATVSYNFFAVTLSLFVDSGVLLAWVFSGIYAIVGIPGAWILWYGRLYNAAKHDRAFTFMCYFIGYAAHIVFCIWAAIAFPLGEQGSFCGLIRTLELFKDDTWLGVIFLIGFVGWTASAVLSIYVWQQAMRDFRGRGGPQELRTSAENAAGRAAMNAAVRQATRA